jgi:hypothetical protein
MPDLTSSLWSTKEVSGDHIHASDGEIGHVDDFLINETTWRVDYLVVDKSNWIGGRWTTLKAIDWPNSELQVGLSRDAVKRSLSIESAPITVGEDGPPPFLIM